jgi:hypothetical protein
MCRPLYFCELSVPNVADLKTQLASQLEAFEHAESPTVRRMMESEIEKTERQIKQAEGTRGRIEMTEKSIRSFRHYAEHIMEHPSEILTKADNLFARRMLLTLFFEETPTYNEILNGTPKLASLFKLSGEFTTNKTQFVSLLYPEWNTLESMVLRWNDVFETMNVLPGMPVMAL